MCTLCVRWNCACIGQWIYIYMTYTIFLWSDAAATIYFAARFVRLLFEGGVYFVQELRIVRLLFEGGHYSRVASIQRNTVCVQLLNNWRLFTVGISALQFYHTKLLPCNLRTIMYNIFQLTGAYRPIACVSSVARAGVISWCVMASCIVMTAIVASSTFIHICSWNTKVTTVIVTAHDC